MGYSGVFREKFTAIVSTVIVVAFIATIFFAWGMQGYTSLKDTSAGSVNGDKITRHEFIRYLQKTEEMLRQAGVSINNEEMQRFVIQRAFSSAVYEKLLLQKANSYNIEVSDKRVFDTIRKSPEFQENGEFSPTKYRQIISASPLTVEMFENDIRKNLLLNTLQNLFIDTVKLSASTAETYYKIKNYKAIAEIYKLDKGKIIKNIKISESKIRKYFNNNKEREYSSNVRHIKAKYTFLQPEKLATKMITDNAVKENYLKNKNKYKLTEPLWKVSQILFNNSEEAKKILIKVKKNSKDWENFAKKYSKDNFSKLKGGNLGWLSAEEMVTGMKEAVKSLKPGEIYPGVVSTIHGYQILRVEDIKRKGELKPFIKVKEEVKSDLLHSKLSEINGNLSEYLNSIERAMKNDSPLPYKLNLETTDYFNIDTIPEEMGIFSDESDKEKLINLKKDQTASFKTDRGFIIVKIISSVKPYIARYIDVKEQIRKKLIKEEEQKRMEKVLFQIKKAVDNKINTIDIVNKFPFKKTRTKEFGILDNIENIDANGEDLSIFSTSIDFFTAVFSTEKRKLGGPIKIFNENYYISPIKITKPDVQDFVINTEKYMAEADKFYASLVFNNWYNTEAKKSRILQHTDNY